MTEVLSPTIIDLAKQTVDDFIDRESKKKTKRLWRENHGLGCGCNSCTHLALNEAKDAYDRVDWKLEAGRWKKK